MRKNSFSKAVGFLTAFIFIITPWVWADEVQLMTLINDLQKQMERLQGTIEHQASEIRELKSGGLQVSGPSQGESATPPMSDYEFNERLGAALGGANKWLKELKMSGDLRLRYEAFDFTSGHPSETDSRNRFRYRLRYGFEKTFNPDMKIGFSMASGESSSGVQVDPTSTNTTFDNLFNFKDIFIEKAYATYTPPFLRGGLVQKTELTAGKLTNPFEKGSSDIVWDRDVKPEGIYEKVDVKLLDSRDMDVSAYLTLGQFILDEDAVTGGDAELFAHQLGVNPVIYTPFLERPVELLTAASYYNFSNYAAANNFSIGGTSLARGNSNVFDGKTLELDAEGFEVWEIYNELSFYPGGLPIRPFFDYAHNIGNDLFSDQSGAYALGIKMGGIVKKGDWETSYAYKRIEPDSTVGAFNDSDFGNGHSGKRGSVFKAAYALTDNIQLNAAAIFVNNLAAGNPLTTVRDEEQRRFQTDLVWKF